MTSLETLHNLIPLSLASLSFVYVLLPVCLLIFYLAPKRFRPVVLLAASAGFYMLASPGHMLLCVAVVIADYAFVSAAVMLRGHFLRRVFMWICVITNLGLIGYFGVLAQSNDTAQPLGLFVICISGIDAMLEAYREEEPQTRNFVRFALYVSFFPRLYAGPLSSPKEFYENCANLQADTATVLIGFGRLAAGLLKYAVIGRSLFLMSESVRAIPAEELSVLSSWVFVLSFAFALYFTFSGLADIARGIAGMFGIDLPQNFYYPYQSRSVSDFFERFNMTFGAFLKRSVLSPLSPSPEKPDSVADSINIMLVGMLWGLWFGISGNCFIWGAFIAVFIIMEKYVYPRALKAVPTLFCRGYALFVVLLSFTLFAGDSLIQSRDHFSYMFGLNGIDLFNGRILYILSMNWILLLISTILVTNIISLLVSGARKAFPRASLSVFAAVDICALVLFTSFTLGGGVL